MANPSLGQATFLLAECPDCAKQVLTWLDLDDGGEAIHRCVDCDRVMLGGLTATDSSGLDATGYGVVEARQCGNGGGCGSGCGDRAHR